MKASTTWLLLAGLTIGCRGSQGDTGTNLDECDPTETRVGVMTSIVFAGEEEDGSALGFDLDGHTTSAGDGQGCGKPDFLDPEGNPGIDNAFARLIPAIEATEAVAVTDIVTNLIKSGELLLLVELESLDSNTDDSCVNMNILRGSGDPILSPESDVISGQTFDRDDSFVPARVDEVALVDGRVDGRPIEMALPFDVFDVSIDFQLDNGAARVELGDDGAMTGFFSGGTDIEYILEVAQTANVDPEVYEVLEPLLNAAADIDSDGDGTCEQISVTLQFDAVSAYIFAD